MSAVKFNLLTERKKKSGKHHFVLPVTSGIYREYVFTDYFCKKEEWHKDNEVELIFWSRQ